MANRQQKPMARLRIEDRQVPPEWALLHLDMLLPTLKESDKAQVEIINRTMPQANAFSSRPKGFGTWTDEWMKTSQAVGFGRMTPEQGYDKLKKKWDELIK